MATVSLMSVAVRPKLVPAAAPRQAVRQMRCRAGGEDQRDDRRHREAAGSDVGGVVDVGLVARPRISTAISTIMPAVITMMPVHSPGRAGSGKRGTRPAA